MVAGRELFATQVRARLVRKGFTPRSAEDAVRRLRLEGAIDDQRAASAWARYAAEIKSRAADARCANLNELGVSTHDAQRAVDEAYAGVSEAELLRRVLGRRHADRSRTGPSSVNCTAPCSGQGFESSAIVAVLKAKTASTVSPDDE